MELLKNAALGGIAGLVYGAEGYLSQDEAFNIWKLLPDVVISGIAGAFIGLQSESIPAEAGIQAGITALGALGVTKLIRKGFKALAKRI